MIPRLPSSTSRTRGKRDSPTTANRANNTQGLLLSHPKIKDVAVTAIDDPAQATEVPRAYVVLDNDEKGTPEAAKEIQQWLQSRVAHHKRLRGGVRFMDEIPKSASGKILRRVLKDQAKREEGKAKL